MHLHYANQVQWIKWHFSFQRNEVDYREFLSIIRVLIMFWNSLRRKIHLVDKNKDNPYLFQLRLPFRGVSWHTAWAVRTRAAIPTLVHGPGMQPHIWSSPSLHPDRNARNRNATSINDLYQVSSVVYICAVVIFYLSNGICVDTGTSQGGHVSMEGVEFSFKKCRTSWVLLVGKAIATVITCE